MTKSQTERNYNPRILFSYIRLYYLKTRELSFNITFVIFLQTNLAHISTSDLYFRLIFRESRKMYE